jgi:3-phosphoshikimate 1-carboxyvinyltransferase
MGAAAGLPIEATFTGDASLSGRPMERVLGPLRAMGAAHRRGEYGFRRRSAAATFTGSLRQ